MRYSPTSRPSHIGADRTPLTLGGTFSPSNKMDVGASLSFLDLAHAGDFLVVGLHAALRM